MRLRANRSADVASDRYNIAGIPFVKRACIGALLLMSIVALTGLSGCSRSFWRRNAEDNAYDVLGEKITDPRWESPRLDITPDARSRFYDPTDPDHPPLPPDDPSAHQYMHWMAGVPWAKRRDKPWAGGVFWPPFARTKGFRGWKGWHKFGEQFSVENPQWLEPFEMAPDQLEAAREENPEYKPKLENLTLPQAVELSLIHSRDFQTQLENLFLTSLQLTFERFRFKVRYLNFGGTRPTSVLTGESIPKTEDSLTWTNRLGVSQLMPWGAQWAVELSNNTLWLFSSDQTGSASSLSYALVQPILQGAGRKVVLENLTQGERNVLYAVRNFARFRQGFFTTVVSGQGGSTVPGNTGGVSASAGGGTGYLQLLSQRQSIKNRELNIRLIESQSDRLQVLAAQESEIPYGSVKLPAGIKFPEVLGDRVRYSPVSGQLQWMDPVDITDEDEAVLLKFAETDYFTSEMEKFVRSQIDDRLGGEPKRPEKLMLKENPSEEERNKYETEVRRRQTEYEEKLKAYREEFQSRLERQLPEAIQDYLDAVTDLVDNIRNVTTPLQVTQLQSQLVSARASLLSQELTYRQAVDSFKFDQLGLPTDLILSIDESMLQPFELIDDRLLNLQSEAELLTKTRTGLDAGNPDIAQALSESLQRLIGLRDDVRNIGIEMLEEDIRRFNANLPARLDSLENQLDKDRITTNYESDHRLFTRIKDDLVTSVDRPIELLLEESRALNDVPPKPNQEPEIHLKNLRRIISDLQTAQEDLLSIVQGLTVIQVNLRVELIHLNPFNMTMTEATNMGLENRLDLMNSRATVMDLRRKIEVSGNSLLGILNLRFEGDVNTRGLLQNTQPLEFIGSESSYRAGINFTAPLDQVTQRNAYRTALIAYQRARRDYMLAEDTVKFEIRNAWRQVTTGRETFEYQRQSVRIAARQFDQTVETTTKNPDTGSTANSGLNLIQALNGVLNAQNGLISNWVTYETNRLNIHRDMGIMQIDETGLWLDEYYQQLRTDSFPPTPNPPDGEMLPPPAPSTDESETPDETNSEIAPPAAQDDIPRLAPFGDLNEDPGISPDIPEPALRQRAARED